MTFGIGKFIWERWKSYMVIVTMALNLRMNVLIQPIAWYWYPIVFIGSIVVVWLDWKYVVSNENGAGLKKNTEFQEMKKMVEEIKTVIVGKTECPHDVLMPQSLSIVKRCGRCGKIVE